MACSMSSRRRAERTRFRPYVMIWPITAPDFCVTCIAPAKLPAFKYGVTAFHSALFFAVVIVRIHPAFDRDRRAESEDDDDGNHEDPAVLEEPDDDVIDLHLSLLFALPVQGIVVTQMPFEDRGIDGCEHLVEQGVHGAPYQVAQVRLLPRNDIEHLRQFRIAGN